MEELLLKGEQKMNKIVEQIRSIAEEISQNKVRDIRQKYDEDYGFIVEVVPEVPKYAQAKANKGANYAEVALAVIYSPIHATSANFVPLI